MKITTHVLDTAGGRPAASMAVRLDRRVGDRWGTLGTGVTGPDGRLLDWQPPTVPLADGVQLVGAQLARQWTTGVYRLVFDTGGWFAARQTVTFYPEVVVVFAVADPTEHHHVPLLLAPFGYSTYRGS